MLIKEVSCMFVDRILKVSANERKHQTLHIQLLSLVEPMLTKPKTMCSKRFQVCNNIHNMSEISFKLKYGKVLRPMISFWGDEYPYFIVELCGKWHKFSTDLWLIIYIYGPQVSSEFISKIVVKFGDLVGKKEARADRSTSKSRD